jgi:hypothetical protein
MRQFSFTLRTLCGGEVLIDAFVRITARIGPQRPVLFAGSTQNCSIEYS